MMDTASSQGLFDRLAQLAATVKAVRKEAAHIARSIDDSTEAGADLRLQLAHAADSLEEPADLLRPARWHRSLDDRRN